MSIKIKLPPLYLINTRLGENLIQQVGQAGNTIEAEIAHYTSPKIKGEVVIPKTANVEQILLVQKKTRLTDSFNKLILADQNSGIGTQRDLDLSTSLWLKHPDLSELAGDDELVSKIVASWQNGFSFISEDEEKNIDGLREPQIGAIHAIHAHWAVTNDAATVVMPTGTGKTETMISVLVSSQCRRVLIVVPTDALRKQIAEKFLSFGILKNLGVIAPSCSYPIVGTLKHKPKSIDEVDEFFTRCNVIVTTSHIAGQADENAQERMAHHCSTLFIDEAHHGGADTWKAIKSKFASKQVLQFTATPYREDDRPIEGKIIFKYPLKRAQEKGYFTKINFKTVKAFAKKKRDQAIAALAVKQLRDDLKKHNHILMARVNTIERAKEVFSIYEQYKEFNPVQIHTGIKAKKARDEVRRKLLNGESKIVVCVDMLGEGFDLPELKIAAFHDIKKSPTVTIQLAGRFTRARPDLGEATFIANVGDEEVRSELRKLYTREPDWNFLLPQLSEELIQEQLDLNQLAEGFGNFPKEIPIQSLCPALSTVIYRTKCEEWTPDNFLEGLVGAGSFEKTLHDINEESRTLIIITVRKVPVEWTKVKDVFNWDWNLYVVFWDKEQSLLFINNSSNSGDFKKLAHAVAGTDAALIRGDTVFRCFGNMNRITFKNIGLSEHLGRMVSYTGRMGSDVEPVLTEIQKQRASKSVLVGTGFENGERTSIGCSAKGRIWSHARSFRLNRLLEWCSEAGRKILDDGIDPNEFLKNTLVSQFISVRPTTMPFGVTWNEEIYKSSESAITFRFGPDLDKQLYEVDINLVEPSQTGDLRFEIASEEINAQFSLTLHLTNDVEDFSLVRNTKNQLMVVWGASQVSAEEFFYEYPPTIWFVDGSELCGNKYTAPIKRLETYRREAIQAWDWSGVNIRKESQKIEKRKDSIQYKVIQDLKKGDYDLVFDDDSSGEAADIVTVKVKDNDRVIEVDLYHCKFSGDLTPGSRIDDLYQVCGQSQKSIRWMENPREFFLHLLRREEKRTDEEGVSRIEKGDPDEIEEIAEKSIIYRTQFRVFMVQPGLSQKKASLEQLNLLSVTESYLRETYLIPLTVVGSE
jgi:superfamily II DNA or RNA helicase